MLFMFGAYITHMRYGDMMRCMFGYLLFRIGKDVDEDMAVDDEYMHIRFEHSKIGLDRCFSDGRLKGITWLWRDALCRVPANPIGLGGDWACSARCATFIESRQSCIGRLYPAEAAVALIGLVQHPCVFVACS